MRTLDHPLVQRVPEVRSAVAPVPAPVPAPMPQAQRPVVPQGMSVSQPGDASEREAARVASKVVSLPAVPVSATASRFAGAVPAIRGASAAQAGRAAAAVQIGAPTPYPALGASGGQALPVSVRRFMEPRFNADFSNVRIHGDEAAAARCRELNAAAFTVGHQIFFARGAFQPDTREGRELLAHELAHTIQQGAAPQQQVQRSLETRLSERSGPAIQRLGAGDALAFFAERAAAIPGFRLLT